MIKTLVFDFDGTLVDSNRIKKDAFFMLSQKFSIPINIIEESLKENSQRDRYDITQYICKKIEKPDLYKEMIEFYGFTVESSIINGEEILGAERFLKKYSKKKLICVNSRTPDENLNAIINKKNWSLYFNKILGSKNSKVQNLQTIQSQFELKKDEMLFVGDAYEDMKAAQDFGCAFYLVKNLSNTDLHSQCPGFYNYSEFDKILELSHV